MSTGKTAVADLWRLVLASPSDTALQAEYLQVVTQEGDPFAEAEMVRLATEINEISYTRNYRWEAITKQYDRLAQRRKSEFDAKLKPWQAELSFAVGWPSEITIPARAFREYAAEVVATVPLRHLNLTEVGAAPEVFEVPELQQIVSLNGSKQPWTAEAISALADSPRLGSLDWLDLSRTGISDAEVEILAASPQLRHLSYINLENNPCRDPVDAAAGYGTDWMTNSIVPESIYLPRFGRELEARYGKIPWLNSLYHFMEFHPPNRYSF